MKSGCVKMNKVHHDALIFHFIEIHNYNYFLITRLSLGDLYIYLHGDFENSVILCLTHFFNPLSKTSLTNLSSQPNLKEFIIKAVDSQFIRHKVLIQQPFYSSLHGTGCQLIGFQEFGRSDFSSFSCFTYSC